MKRSFPHPKSNLRPWSHQDHPDAFFASNNRMGILLSRKAAIEVIEQASERGWEILRYEGGIFKDGRFEAHLDAIWDRLYTHTGKTFLEIGNIRAIQPLMEEPEEYNAFIITARPLVE